MIIVQRLFEEKSYCYLRMYRTLKESNLVGDIEEEPIGKLTKVTIKINSKDLYNTKVTFPDAEMLEEVSEKVLDKQEVCV